jgi:hypothetical protein
MATQGGRRFLRNTDREGPVVRQGRLRKERLDLQCTHASRCLGAGEVFLAVSGRWCWGEHDEVVESAELRGAGRREADAVARKEGIVESDSERTSQVVRSARTDG